MKKAEVKPILMEELERLPEEALQSAADMNRGYGSSGDPMQKRKQRKEARMVLTDPEEKIWPIDAGGKKKSAAARAKAGKVSDGASTKTGGGRKSGTAANAKRAKAKKPNEKLTPASIYRKLIAFGKIYQVEGEQDFQEAARLYAEEVALIDQMRDRLDTDGLTVMKTYKTGDCEVAHPLLSELPRHVESANRCLLAIGDMIEKRGAKREGVKRDLDAFRLHR